MNDNSRWVGFALLGAFFAAVTQVASKPASDRLGPNVVSLTRAVVMTSLFIGVVIYEGRNPGSTGGGASSMKAATAGEAALTRHQLYALAVGAGLAASLSWFFGYKALSLASVSKTYPIDKLSVAIAVVLAVVFLGERPNLLNWSGIALMIGGAWMVTHKG